MPVPELPTGVVERFATVLREAIAGMKLHNPSASEYEQADAVGISRVQLRNLADGLADRAKGTSANPRLTTLVALSRAYGLRIVIDASHTDGVVEFVVDEDVLRRHADGMPGRPSP